MEYCRFGHELTDANSTWQKSRKGILHRRCKECKKRHQARLQVGLPAEKRFALVNIGPKPAFDASWRYFPTREQALEASEDPEFACVVDLHLKAPPRPFIEQILAWGRSAPIAPPNPQKQIYGAWWW